MNEPSRFFFAWLSGMALGAIFFGGLWWTIRRALSSQHPALWFMGSLLLRMSITLAGFYLLARNHWRQPLLGLLGFVMARLLVTWLTRPRPSQPSHSSPEAAHAPYA